MEGMTGISDPGYKTKMGEEKFGGQDARPTN
jgi:hypothetical protein